MLATGSASPAIAFQATGHWVFNRAERAVAHVDGGTNQVDARVAVPNAGPAPLFTLQGDKQGFIVGRQAVTVFGRSTLTVDNTFPTAGPEVPVGIEVLGGPYLVYRQAGTIVRLGVPPTTIPVGGRVGRPAYTDDGTVWVHRTDNGVICALRRDSDALDCSAQAPPGLAGSLTVVSTSAAFVDTVTDAAQIIDAPTAGVAAPLGVDLPVDTSLIADRDTQGRLPVVVPGPNRLLLADTAGVPAGRGGGPPVTVGLGDGTFTSPVASDGVVAVVEQTHNRLLVFAVDGRSLGETDLPPGSGPASITRGGDGRIYVDDADGAATHVVEADGSVKTVNTGGAVAAVSAAPAQLAALISPPVQDPTRTVPAPPGRHGGPPVQVPTPLPPVTNPPVPAPPPLPPPVELPSAPTDVTAALGAKGAVAVTWSAADGHGLPVTYSVSANGAAQRTTATTAVTLAGLARGVSYTFVVTATTSAGTGPPSAPSSALTIPELLRVVSPSLAAATLGTAYSVTVIATGGVAPYRWSKSAGSLPAGLMLSLDGVVSGTPTSGVAGSFTAQVEDGAKELATASFTVTVTIPQVRGDINRDGKVDCGDLNIVLDQFGQKGPGLSGDLNNDSAVTIADLSIVLSNFNKGVGPGSSEACKKQPVTPGGG
jgi:hypothetical protein